MSQFNEKIKKLLEFSASFEDFKLQIDGEIKKLADEISGNRGVSESKFSEAMSNMEREIKSARLDRAELDSARRTFGEEVGVLKSYIDKQSREFSNRLCELDSLSDIDEIKKSLSNIKEPVDYGAAIDEIKRSIKSLDIPNHSKEIKQITDRITKVEAVKPVDSSKQLSAILERLKKIESVKPVDYSISINDIKSQVKNLTDDDSIKKQVNQINNTIKSLPEPIDNSEQIKALESKLNKRIEALSEKLTKQQDGSKKAISSMVNSKQLDDAVKSLSKSVADINKKVSEINSESQDKAIREGLQQANGAVKKLQSEFNKFKSAFEE